MPRPLHLGLLFHLRSLLASVVVRSGPDPSSLSRVVVHVVCPTQVVLPSLPPRRQSSLSILKSTEARSIITPATRSVRISCRTCNCCAASLSRSSGSTRGSIARQRGRGLRTDWRVHAIGNRWCRPGAGCRRPRGVVLAGCWSGRSEVSGNVEDELPIDYQIVVRLSEVSREHFCIESVNCPPLLR